VKASTFRSLNARRGWRWLVSPGRTTSTPISQPRNSWVQVLRGSNGCSTLSANNLVCEPSGCRLLPEPLVPATICRMKAKIEQWLWQRRFLLVTTIGSVLFLRGFRNKEPLEPFFLFVVGLFLLSLGLLHYAVKLLPKWFSRGEHKHIFIESGSKPPEV